MNQYYVNDTDKLLETAFYYPVDTDHVLSKVVVTFTDSKDRSNIYVVETEIEER